MSANHNYMKSTILKALGIETKDGKAECTGRKGMVYLRLPNGEAKPFAIDKTGSWSVCECEHEALEMVMGYMSYMLGHVLEAAKKGDLLWVPSPSDFFYVFTDDMEDDDIEVGDEAATLIANIMEKS